MIDAVLGDHRVIATVTIDDAANAVPVAQALVDGGVPTVEIMLRTDAGLTAIEAVRAGVPDAIVGAGTVLTPDRLTQAHAAGAAFGVAPGFDGPTVERAAELDIPFLPGAITPSEIQTCLAHGITTLKFFPAEAAGGLATIKALHAAYSVAGVRFVTTGGVDDTNAEAYLSSPAVRAIGLSWLATSTLVRNRDVESIRARALQLSRLLERVPA